jgi:D-serine deaminase-like pyridoxal phosphate-dependent protein
MYTDSISKPTLVLNPDIAHRNLKHMAEKARLSGVTFRPHFKTHQSRQIGEWFRAEGVKSITVSSVDMAQYFAGAGWKDILIAFTANRRELQAINQLAHQVRLGILFEEADTLGYFMEHLHSSINVWLEADNGNGRTGIPIQDTKKFIALAGAVSRPHRLAGILTHAGNTYHAASTDEIRSIYTDTLAGMQQIKTTLVEAGWKDLVVSFGDTPTLSLAERFEGMDEIRPGNFIFYDCSQLTYGSCQAEDIAVAVACPVIATYPQRGQLVLYGGGVHLSKDYFKMNEQAAYGLVSLPTDRGWGPPLPDAYVSALWQEHALVNLDPTWLAAIHPGDLLMVLPSHSCMTVDLFDSYLTPQGEQIAIKS